MVDQDINSLSSGSKVVEEGSPETAPASHRIFKKSIGQAQAAIHVETPRLVRMDVNAVLCSLHEIITRIHPDLFSYDLFMEIKTKQQHNIKEVK